jgi:hypothetical protein
LPAVAGPFQLQQSLQRAAAAAVTLHALLQLKGPDNCQSTSQASAFQQGATQHA